MEATAGAATLVAARSHSNVGAGGASGAPAALLRQSHSGPHQQGRVCECCGEVESGIRVEGGPFRSSMNGSDVPVCCSERELPRSSCGTPLHSVYRGNAAGAGGVGGAHSSLSLGLSAMPVTSSGRARSRRKSFEESKPSALPEVAKAWTVLIAEDNKVNQMVVSRMLKGMGVRHEIVENGRLALEACQKGEYDLVLMDCHMPEMDGLEATKMIRKHETSRMDGRAMPIAALTASAFEFEKQACFKAGMTHFLTKPVRPKDLEDLIHDICSRKEKVDTDSEEAPSERGSAPQP